MAVVCLLNPQRGVFGSPFMNNMTSDLLIRAFNLKCNKEKGSANKQSSQNITLLLYFEKGDLMHWTEQDCTWYFCIKIKLSVSFIDLIINFSENLPPPPHFPPTVPICLLFQYKSSNDNFFPSQVLLVSGLPYPSSKQYYRILQHNTAATVWELTCPPDWSV